MQFNRTALFEHAWEKVAAAHWLKYPNTQHMPHVEHVDYLDRYLDAQGRLHTIRLIRCRQPVPDWIMRLGSLLIGGASSEAMFVREHSIVDADTQVMRLWTRPMGLPEYAEVEEECEYQTTPDFRHTVMRQSVRVSLGDGWFTGLARRVEEWCIARFEQNAEKGKIALEDALLHKVNEPTLLLTTSE